MTMTETEQPSLFDLLCRRWDLSSPVIALAFTPNSGSVAFLDRDGRFWQTTTADPESPNHRMRVAGDTGRMTISPRRKPPPELQPFALEDRITCFAPLQTDRFAVGCETGRLVSVTSTGRITALAREEEALEAICSAGSAQGIIASAGGTIRHHPSDGRTSQIIRIGTGHVTALASTSDGASVAWLDDAGVGIGFNGIDTDIRIPLESEPDARTTSSLAWNRRGDWLGVASGGRAISLAQFGNRYLRQTLSRKDYPAPVTEMSWSDNGDLLATNGAFRAIVWDVAGIDNDIGGVAATIVTGRPRLIPVSAIALHPRKPLVAVGYENGSIIVAQVGEQQELVISETLWECPTSMRWSSDGHHLAMGTQGGMAAVLTFPPTFFK